MLEETQVDCPYCGETFTAVVDLSAGDQQYIEDCQVCCNPIVFSINMSGPEEFNLETRRDNE